MGSVVERKGKDGKIKYGARAYVGYKDGKRVYKWLGTFAKEKDAERAIRKVESAKDNGETIPTGKLSVKQFMEDWLELKQADVRWNTFKKYKWLTEHHVIPSIGHIQLEKLSPKDLQLLYAKLKPILSERSILHLHNMMHAALKQAVAWGNAQRNVADKELVSPPHPKEEPKKQIWTTDELRRFLTCAQHYRYGVVFLIAAMTGMRKAEICGLKWRDVDMTNRQLHVRQTLVYVSGEGATLQDTKTTRSRRTISLDSITVDFLGKHRKKQLQEKLLMGGDYEDSDFVIAREDGRPVSTRTVDNQWLRCIEEAGVPHMGIHGLRHTHASTLIAQGIPVNVVSERLGHARTSITMDIYVHSNDDQQRQAANSFAASIFDDKYAVNKD